MVTPALFKKYRTAPDYAAADAGDPRAGRSLHRVLSSEDSLDHRYGEGPRRPAMAGRCRDRRESLTALPGVGLKTANVISGNAFGEQAIAVDTHVFRVSQRLGSGAFRGPRRDPRPARRRAANETELDASTTHLLQSHGSALLRGEEAARVQRVPCRPSARGPARPRFVDTPCPLL